MMRSRGCGTVCDRPVLAALSNALARLHSRVARIWVQASICSTDPCYWWKLCSVWHSSVALLRSRHSSRHQSCSHSTSVGDTLRKDANVWYRKIAGRHLHMWRPHLTQNFTIRADIIWVDRKSMCTPSTMSTAIASLIIRTPIQIFSIPIVPRAFLNLKIHLLLLLILALPSILRRRYFTISILLLLIIFHLIILLL